MWPYRGYARSRSFLLLVAGSKCYLLRRPPPPCVLHGSLVQGNERIDVDLCIFLLVPCRQKGVLWHSSLSKVTFFVAFYPERNVPGPYPWVKTVTKGPARPYYKTQEEFENAVNKWKVSVATRRYNRAMSQQCRGTESMSLKLFASARKPHICSSKLFHLHCKISFPPQRVL